MFWSYSNIYLLTNVLLWFLTFIIYQKRRKYFGAGSFLLFLYLSISVVGFHLYNLPIGNEWFVEIKIVPFLYLYVMIMLATLPVLKFKEQETASIQQPSNLFLKIITILIVVASLSQLKHIFTDFSSGLSKMLIDTGAGQELYLETFSKADQAGDGKIENIAIIISGMLSNISILFLFYNLTLIKKNKLIIIGLSLSVILTILSSLASGARGGMTNTLLTAIISYVLLRNFMSLRTRKMVTRIGIIMVLLISIPFLLITVSRFENNKNFDTLSSIEWYYGQSFLNFNNYGLDAGDIRNGDRTSALFKQMIWSDTPRNYFERLYKYSHMKMNESVFYTFVGDFTLDFGPIISFFIFNIASVFFSLKTKVFNQTILFHQLILLFFVICVCVQGALTLFSFSDIGGNLNLITFILVYFWFRIDYFRQQNLSVWQK